MATLKSENFEPCLPSSDEIIPDLEYDSSIDGSPLNTPKLDRYSIFFTLPKCIYSTFSVKNSDKLLFHILNLPTPEISVPAIESTYHGYKVKHSSHERTGYENITVNFKVGHKFTIYNILYKWLNFLNNERTGVYGNPSDSLLGHPKEYTTDIVVCALDNYSNDKIVASWTYKDAFITKLGAIEWNSKSENEDITSSFELAFNELKFTLHSNLN